MWFVKKSKKTWKSISIHPGLRYLCGKVFVFQSLCRYHRSFPSVNTQTRHYLMPIQPATSEYNGFIAVRIAQLLEKQPGFGNSLLWLLWLLMPADLQWSHWRNNRRVWCRYIWIHHRQVSSAKKASLKHYSIKTNAYLRLTKPENYQKNMNFTLLFETA